MKGATDGENLDENALAANGGVLSLFDGQKNYAQLKLQVDYSIVEHVEHGVIEVIGVCLPAMQAGRPPAGAAAASSQPTSRAQSPGASSGGGGSGAASVMSPHSSMPNIHDPTAPPPVVRLYVGAEAFYAKVSADKQAMDRKNRRPEQTLPKRSKVMRNMVAQSLLGAMSLSKIDGGVFVLKMPPLDGVQFDCVKPSEVVPFDHTPALVAYNAHAEAAKAGGAGAGAGPPTLDDSYGPPKRKPSFLQKMGSAIGLIPVPPATESDAVEAVGNDAVALEDASKAAKEAASVFVSAIDNIKDMFDFKQRYKDEHGLTRPHVPKSTRRSVDSSHGEADAPAPRRERYSLLAQPNENVKSLEELQNLGREGPGSMPLDQVVQANHDTAAAGGGPTAAHAAATAAAAKIVLTAAGVTPQSLSNQADVAIGDKKVKVKRPAFIPPQIGSFARAVSNSIRGALAFKLLEDPDTFDASATASPTTKALGGPPKVDPETGSLPKDSPRQTARVSLSSNPAAAPAPAAAGGGGGSEPYVKVTSTVTTATTTTTSNFIIRTSTLDFKVPATVIPLPARAADDAAVGSGDGTGNVAASQ